MGGNYTEYELTSPCINGQETTVTVVTIGLDIGLSLPVSETRYDVTFEDHLDVIRPDVFNGSYGSASASGIAGPRGGDAESLRVGDAYSRGSSNSRGIDVGISVEGGRSTVTNRETRSCSCNN